MTVSVRKSITHKLNEKVELIFQVTQHTIDEAFLRSFIKYLDCGRISKSGKAIDYQVSRFSYVENKIIPFFKKYKILGVKSAQKKSYFFFGAPSYFFSIKINTKKINTKKINIKKKYEGPILMIFAMSYK